MTPSSERYSIAISFLTAPASSALEELDQGGRDRGGLHVVLLPRERPTLRIRKRGGHRIRAVAQPWPLATVDDKRGNVDLDERGSGQRVVAHQRGVVDQRMCGCLLLRPPRRLAHLRDDLSRHADGVSEEELDHVAAATLGQQRHQLPPVVTANLRPAVVDDEGRLPQGQLLDVVAEPLGHSMKGEYTGSRRAIDECRPTGLPQYGIDVLDFALDRVGLRISALAVAPAIEIEDREVL